MNLSKISFFLCSSLLLYCGTIFSPRWKNTAGEAQLSWDAGGYYWYLPSAFIYKDLKGQGFHDSIMQKYQPSPPHNFQYAYQVSSGNFVVRYTMGMAIMEFPFFTIAHIVAKPLGYPADGFSRPYQFMVFAGAMLFVFAGLWYLRKLLLFYYADHIVAIVLFLLVAGTSYLNYGSMDIGMTHCWLFSLYVFIMLNTHYYYRTLKLKYALLTGALVGLATLIRPPEIITALIPVLWGMDKINTTAWKAKISFIRQHYKAFLFAFLICCLMISPQFIYWKYATGNWFVYTYQDQGFSWLSPHFGQYTFNFQCGWLVYSPVMIFAVLGIFSFIKNGSNKVAILAIILVNYYIVTSWNGWDYGGRAMVQSYPALLFPLASFVRLICTKTFRLVLTAPVLLLFSYVNIWWTYQAHKGGLVAGLPGTSAYFWATVLRYKVPEDIQKLRDNPHRYTQAVKSSNLIYSNDLTTDNPDGVIKLKKDAAKSKIYSVPKPIKDYKWLRASADIHIDEKEENVWFMTSFVIQLRRGTEIIQSNAIRVQRLLEPNSTRNIYLDARISSQHYDKIEILFFNENNGAWPCVIDNLKVIGFNE